MEKIIVHRAFDADWETIHQYIQRGILQRAELSLANPLNANKDLIFDCEFNGGVFEIKSGSTVDSCYADWNASMTKNQEEYEKSEEYAQWQAERKAQSIRMNAEVAVLLKSFMELPFDHRDTESMEKILNWLCSYQPYSDCTLCTEKNDTFVVSKLKEVGFQSNANIKLNSYTAEEMFVYIVGQAISTMEMVALHGAIISFVDKWKKEYLSKN